jgi:membrane protein
MMKIHKLGNALLKSFKYFSEDKILKYSASLAYTTVFSMGPLLIVIIFLASFFYDREAAGGKDIFPNARVRWKGRLQSNCKR